jgi:hypothetical protein
MLAVKHLKNIGVKRKIRAIAVVPTLQWKLSRLTFKPVESAIRNTFKNYMNLSEKSWVDEIESLREMLNKSTEQITTSAGVTTIGEVCRSASVVRLTLLYIWRLFPGSCPLARSKRKLVASGYEFRCIAQ